MGRGRKPLAPEIHERNGSYVKNPQRKNRSAPKATKGRPTKPPSVKVCEHASKRWTSLLKQLDELGLLAKCDTDLFELYCVTYGKYRTALEDVNANGLTIVGVKGNVMRNPAAIELHQSMEKLAKLMPELGLTPSARARLIADQAEDVDPFLEFLEASKN